ncbi:MAG: hypothetical protein P8173_17440, partial [Gammaproteobacteria bacterium]
FPSHPANCVPTFPTGRGQLSAERLFERMPGLGIVTRDTFYAQHICAIAKIVNLVGQRALMIRTLLVAALILVAAPLFTADVGVSVSVGESGFQGDINTGNAPKPDDMYATPVIVREVPSLQQARIPPGYMPRPGNCRI